MKRKPEKGGGNKMDICGKDYSSFINMFIKSLGPVKVLDVGCGTGNHTVLLKGVDNKVFGTDIADVRRKENIGLFDFFLSEPGKIKSDANQFDLVTNMDVLEHIEDDAAFVKEMRRVTNVGGHVLTITPNKYRIANVFRIITRLKKIEYPLNLGKDVFGDCVHIREYTLKSIKDLFLKSDFKSVKVTSFWFGARYRLIERIRISHNIPFPLNLLAQYIIVDAVK
jgi:ubiquinone/menaquinone biosynthesis C-methylase UbiE